MSMIRRDRSDTRETAVDLRGVPPEIAASFGELRKIESRLNALLRDARQTIEASRESLDSPRNSARARPAAPGQGGADGEARPGRDSRQSLSGHR